MTKLLSVDAALQRILENVTATQSEMVGIARAGGRILSDDLRARRTQPPFPASAMDGYAARAGDVHDCPVSLKLIGESAAGHGFTGSISAGECVRIFTGAPVPAGADTIVIQENVTRDGDLVIVEQGEKSGRYVRPAGLDFQEDQVLLSAGDRLSPPRLSLAAAMNHAHLPVHAKPLVAVIATGDELVLPGEQPSADQIIASNSFGVAHIVERAGGEVLDLGIADDTLASLKEKFEQAQSADIIVTLGGASVGDHDLVAQALQNKGVDLNFWKLAMRPGKPVMYGQLAEPNRSQRYLGLPGNPVSSLVCAEIFLVPLIKKMLQQDPTTVRIPAVLDIDLPENDQREEYMRGTHVDRDGTLFVTPFDNQDSSILSLIAKATCLMIRPAFAPAAKAGEPCEIVVL